MFLTFLNKPNNHYLDLSVFINCSPDRILFYYYNSQLKITLDTYIQMKEWAQADGTSKSCLNQWLELIEQEIDMEQDLGILQQSDYLNSIGPYYYTPTNTRFYVTKLNIIDNEALNSIDFGILFNLHKVPAIDKDLERYFKSRKNPKKLPRNKDDLIKDITLCLGALSQIEKITRHADYFNLLLNERNTLIDKDIILPAEPDQAPEKPIKPEEPALVFNGLIYSRSKQKVYQKSCAEYNHGTKIYYIKYREYEKACDRYKVALKDWEQYQEGFVEICLDDIEDAETKLNQINNLSETYNYILKKSFVHSNYHSIKVLNKFKQYLETGRAEDLQDCMNLYEEEKHWIEIKASQERIENTIYFLQSDTDLTNYALKLSNELIASTIDPV